MITVRNIQDRCCEHFDITRDQLLEPCRRRELARPRQLTMYLAREITGLGWILLGKAFCRDHTTILHGYRAALKFKDEWPWDHAIATVQYDLGLQIETPLLERIMRKRWMDSVPREFAPGAYTCEIMRPREAAE